MSNDAAIEEHLLQLLCPDKRFTFDHHTLLNNGQMRYTTRVTDQYEFFVNAKFITRSVLGRVYPIVPIVDHNIDHQNEFGATGANVGIGMLNSHKNSLLRMDSVMLHAAWHSWAAANDANVDFGSVSAEKVKPINIRRLIRKINRMLEKEWTRWLVQVIASDSGCVSHQYLDAVSITYSKTNIGWSIKADGAVYVYNYDGTCKRPMTRLDHSHLWSISKDVCKRELECPSHVESITELNEARAMFLV